MSKVKTSVHRILRHLGFDVVSLASARPSVPGSDIILGSFPPFEHYYVIGPKENYFIHEGYQHRRTTVALTHGLESCNALRTKGGIRQICQKMMHHRVAAKATTL